MHHVVRADVDLDRKGLLVFEPVLGLFAVFALAVGDFLGPEGFLVYFKETVILRIHVIDVPADMASAEDVPALDQLDSERERSLRGQLVRDEVASVADPGFAVASPAGRILKIAHATDLRRRRNDTGCG